MKLTLTLLAIGLTGCALIHQWTKTGAAVERMANVYSGAGSNITQYVQVARSDRQEWHHLLVQFWPHLSAAILGLIAAFTWAYKHEPSKRRR